MATDKRFVVKNGLQTENINFVFNDAVVGSSNITATMLSSNVLSFSGTSGQLFSIADTMTGVIFSVNDISGVPSIEVYDDGRIRMAETFGNVIIGNSTINTSRTSTSTTTGILQVAGGVGVTGNINVGGPVNTFSGNVGIGSTSPKSLLDVASNGGRLRITQDTAGGVLNGIDFVSFNGGVNGGLVWNQANGEVRLNAAVSYFPTFYSNGAEVMRFNTSGNVGIGTTTIQTGYKLQVQGDSAFTNRVGIGTSNIAGISNALVVYGSAMVYGNLDLANPTGGTSGIYFADGTYQTTASVTSSGAAGTVQFSNGSGGFNGDANTFWWDNGSKRLGIGTGSPTNTLSVWGNTPAWFNTTNGSNIFEVLVGNAATTAATLGYASTPANPYSYIKNVGGTNGVVVLNSGFVGIRGITNPQNALDVGGAVAIGNSYAGVRTAPTNGMIVQSSVGVGTFTVASTLDVWGIGSFTSAISAGGTASVNALISNNNIFGSTLNTSGLAQLASLVVNNNSTTSTLNVQNNALVGSLNSNSNVVGVNLQSTGLSSLASLNVNAGTYTNSLNVNTTANVNALTSNTGITVTNGGITVTGLSTFTGNVGITGNLNVTGTINTQNANVLVVNDPIIYLGEGNTSNLWDLGIVANYNDGVYEHTGFVRNRNDGVWTLFDTMTSEPNVSTGNINWADSTLTFAAMKLGNLTVAGNTRSTSSTTGALILNNFSGLGVGGNIYVGGQQSGISGNLWIAGSNASTSSTTGALVVAGGVGMAGNLNVGGLLNTTGNAFVGGNLQVNGGQITTTQTGTAFIFDSNVAGLNIGRSASVINMSAEGANAVYVHGTLVLGNKIITSYNAGAASVFNSNVSSMNIGGESLITNIGKPGGTIYTPGDVSINGGDIFSTAATGTIFNSNVTALSVGQAASTLNLGANSGTMTIGNPTVVGTQATQTLYNTVATTMNFAGAATSVSIGANSGILSIGNPVVLGTQATQSLYNLTTTTMNFAGQATSLNMGASTGTATINNPTLVGSTATQNLYNTTATTMNFAGAATAINMGANTGTLTIGNPTVVGTQTTQNLYNTVATTMNFAGAATTISIGAATGTTTFNSANTSVSTSTGAIRSQGGVGVVGNIYAGGNVVAASFQPTSASVPGTGMYLSSANNLSLAANSGEVARLNSSGVTLTGSDPILSFFAADSTYSVRRTSTTMSMDSSAFTTIASASATSIQTRAGAVTIGTGAGAGVSTRVTVDSTGNVGIGSAMSVIGSVFVRDLTVNAAIQTAGTLTVNALVSNVYGLFGQNVTINSTNASTSTTTGALIVGGGIGIAGNVYAGGNVVAASFQPTSASIPGSGLYLPATNTLAMSTAGSERMRVNSNGNVGIGETNPTQKLDVAGMIRGGDADSTTGSLILSGRYGNGTLFTAGSEFSSGGTYLGYGVRSNTAITGITVSSTGIALNRSSLLLAADITFSTGPNQTVGIGSTVSISERMRITSGGSVGIGSTIPAAKLDVNGDIAATGDIRSTSAGSNQANFQAVNTSNTAYLHMIRTGYQAWYIASPVASSDLYFAETSNSTANSRLYFKTGGNIGIGTIAPGSLLDVNGTASFRSEISAAGTATVNALVSNVYGRFGQNVTVNSTNVSTSTTTGALIVAGGIGAAGNVVAGTFQPTSSTVPTNGMFLPAASTLGFATSSTEDMRLTSNGNLLLGITTAPAGGTSTIVIQGSGTNGSGIEFSNVNVAGANVGIGGGNSLVFSTYTGAVGSETYTERMRLLSNGNFGIGTASPETALHLNNPSAGGDTPRIRFTNTNTGTGATDGAFVGISNNNQLDIYNFEASSVRIATSNNERMRVDANGNVGINNTSPLYRVHVNNVATVGTSASILSNAQPILYLDNGSGIGGSIVIKSHSPGNGNQVGAIKFAASPDASNYSWAGMAGIADTNAAASALAFYTAASNGQATAAGASTERMRIDINGNFLVGLTSGTDSTPSGGQFAGPMLIGGYLSTNQTNRAVLQYFSNEVSLRAYGATSGTGYITLRTGGGGNAADTERMRINSGGNVLIGTTTTPAGGTATVVIQGVGTNGSGIEFSNVNVAGANVGIGFGNSLVFSTYTGAIGSETYTERMRINTGNVNLSTNLTVNSGTTSLFGGNVGIGGNLNVGGTTNLFTGNVGIGTTSTTSNAVSIYNSIDISGNIDLNSVSGRSSGIYFADGTYQTTAVTNQSMATYEYTADGGTTAFSTAPSVANGIANTVVFVNGVYQPKDGYTWSGNVLTFNAPPVQFSHVSINVIGSVAAYGTSSIIGYSSVSGNTTLSPTAPFAIVSGNVTVTLPSATVLGGQVFYVKNIGTGNVVVATINNETIDGSNSLIIDSQWSTAGLLSNGSNWFIF